MIPLTKDRGFFIFGEAKVSDCSPKLFQCDFLEPRSIVRVFRRPANFELTLRTEQRWQSLDENGSGKHFLGASL